MNYLKKIHRQILKTIKKATHFLSQKKQIVFDAFFFYATLFPEVSFLIYHLFQLTFRQITRN